MQRFIPPLSTDTAHRPQLAQLLGPFCALSDIGLVSPAAAITTVVPVRRHRMGEAVFPGMCVSKVDEFSSSRSIFT